MKIQKQPTLADSICDLRARKIKKTFFTQINTLIDWDTISILINKDYSKGKSATGKPSYDGLLLFKMCLLQSWYGLSDYEVEDRINDSLSFSYFCGMTTEQVTPYHITLTGFGTALTKTKTFEKLFTYVNKQLETHNTFVKTSLIIDATLLDTPLRPKGKTNLKVTQDRCEDQVEVHKEYADSVDKEGTWLKKRG